MIDPTPNEHAAMAAGGDAAGAYLESLGKSDLAALTTPEWRQRGRGMPVPSTVTEALAWSRQIAAPTEIAVRPSGRFTEIVSVRFTPCTPASAPSAAASRGALAGSTQATASRIPAATPPGPGSAAGPARTSAIGDAA